jgi:hypothetical protein
MSLGRELLEEGIDDRGEFGRTTETDRSNHLPLSFRPCPEKFHRPNSRSRFTHASESRFGSEQKRGDAKKIRSAARQGKLRPLAKFPNRGNAIVKSNVANQNPKPRAEDGLSEVLT